MGVVGNLGRIGATDSSINSGKCISTVDVNLSKVINVFQST